MRFIITTFALFLFTHIGYSQDLIVTHSGDSLNCKITKDLKQYILCDLWQDGKYKTLYFDPKRIQAKQKDYYKSSPIPLAPTKTENSSTTSYNRWRMAITYGWGYKIFQSIETHSAEEKSYYDALRNGRVLALDAAYFLNPYLGIGIYTNYFRSNNSTRTSINTYGEKFFWQGTLENTRHIVYIGPSISYYKSQRKNRVIMKYSLGYMHYKDDQYMMTHSTISGGTIGSSLSLGYDYQIATNLSLHLNATVIGGILRSAKVEYHKNTPAELINADKRSIDENLIRIDVSAGVCIHF